MFELMTLDIVSEKARVDAAIDELDDFYFCRIGLADIVDTGRKYEMID